ncbi:MAG: GPW/gp25 family protein [Anaerolineae bacterium]|nr:GPW/gp25 family protein [Anaerolineae bacterium]
MAIGLKFPFRVTSAGGIGSGDDDDEQLRGKIIQVLFTAPGERVNLPEFGCGLFNLVFEPNDAVLLAATEFTVGQALTRWLGRELIVNRVAVSEGVDDAFTIEVVYIRRRDLVRRTVRVQFR